ncbi:MAG: hypothetical protein JO291_01780, partial [Acidimicrobiia bacterium]|nr:hypothetical protein [Acidimicrobiia bacterium]
PSLGGGRRGIADERGIAMCVGTMWPETGTWPSEAEWAQRARRGDEHLSGLYAAITVDPRGATTAWTDQLGYRFLYYGERDGVGAVGSDARLVAWALAPAGTAPARDPFGACSLAQRRQHVGALTGYVDVSVALVGERVRLGRDGLRVDQSSQPWIPDAELLRADPDQLITRAGDALASTIRTAAQAPIGRRLFDLTGGKDTRVLFALALQAGITDRFEFFTVGPPSLGDVQVADHLAERYGLRHSTERSLSSDTTPYPEAVGAFVERTGGMANMWNANRPRPPEDRLRVQGLPGELLRAIGPLPDGVETREEVADFCARRIFDDKLGLIRDGDASRRYVQLELDHLHGEALSTLSPADAYHAYRSTRLTPSARYGPVEQLVDHPRVQPFHSSTVLAVALALGRDNRRGELAHRELIRRASQRLAAEPFAGEEWRAMQEVPKAPTPKAPEAEALVARGHRLAFDRRRRFFDEIVEDTANPAWQLIDRAKVIDGLDRFGELRSRPRQEIYGALTAALWLGADDGVVPPAG